MSLSDKAVFYSHIVKQIQIFLPNYGIQSSETNDHK